MRCLWGVTLIAVSTACGRDDRQPNAGATTEEQPRRITVWTDSTELYLESPPLVVGQPVKMAVHLTDLTDFRPVASGALTIRFRPRGAGAPFEVSEAAPKSPGIYGPVVTGSQIGEYDVDLLIHGAQDIDSIRLPVFVIYDPADDIPAGAPPEAGIAFLKEQQWSTAEFRTAFADSATLAAAIEVSATVKAAPDREAIVAAPVAGILEPAGLAEAPIIGQRVATGQPLATLTPTLVGTGSGYGSARARLLEAEHEFARAKRLVAAQAAPGRRLEEATIALDAARAELASLGRDREDGRVVLRAPLGGVVARREATPGGHVAAGSLLFAIVDPAELWLEARVPASLAGSRLRGHPLRATFRVDGDDELRSAGRVLSIDPVIDPTSRTVSIRFAVPNPGSAIPIGATARAWIETAGGDRGVLIPASALVEEDGRPVAYVQIDGERFERRDLEISAQRSAQVLVRRGIRAGERVVTGAAYQVRLASLSTAVPAHGHEH